jgi:hypothetical protein
MNYRQHKDLTLSEIGVGCCALSGAYGQVGVGQFKTMLGARLSLGSISSMRLKATGRQNRSWAKSNQNYLNIT